jgi:D-beta-D-heptose 7-phosphate kinase/D-beta-D-heptose 1-phosphate adenosyltransferase
VSQPPRARDKCSSRQEAARRIRTAQRRGERVVFTSGCFDLLHVGHVRSLEQARSLGDRLVVGVNADATVRDLKGPDRPLVPARQRAELLAALACVDWVVTFREPTPRRVLAELAPDVYAKGGDWPLAVLREKDLPEGFTGEVRRLRQVPGARTTLLVDRIRTNRPSPRRRPTRGDDDSG